MIRDVSTQTNSDLADRESVVQRNRASLRLQPIQSMIPPLVPLTYSVPEVAVLLRINRNTAYELAARGEIPSIRVGRRILIVRAAFEHWLTAPR